jgi:hypothetical protein
MKRRTINLESRGDICARSTCACVGLDDEVEMSGDPELDFEVALMQALAEEQPTVGDRALVDIAIQPING